MSEAVGAAPAHEGLWGLLKPAVSSLCCQDAINTQLCFMPPDQWQGDAYAITVQRVNLYDVTAS